MTDAISMRLRRFNLTTDATCNAIRLTFDGMDGERAQIDTTPENWEKLANVLLQFHADFTVHQAMPIDKSGRSAPEVREATAQLPHAELVTPVALVCWEEGGAAIDLRTASGVLKRLVLDPDGVQYLRSALAAGTKFDVQ